MFRKTLEDQSGPQNLNDLLATVIPNAQVPPGSVVDLGDFVQAQGAAANPLNPTKRARGLLPPIPDHGKASTVASPASTAGGYTPGMHNPQMGYVTEVFDSPDVTSPSSNLVQDLETNPHESMMKIIHDTNANTMAAGFDLPEVVNSAAPTLSQDQRNRMLSMMAQSASPASANTGGMTSSSRMPSAASVSDLASVPSTATAPLSLSPIVGSAPLPPSMSRISADQDTLERLRKLQDEQDDRLENINHILGPLSPSGRIPGLDEEGDGSSYFNDSNINLDEFLDLSGGVPYDFSSGSMHGTGNDFDFSLDGTGNMPGADAGRIFKTGSSANNTPSPSGTEEIARDDVTFEDIPNHNNKRRRVG